MICSEQSINPPSVVLVMLRMYILFPHTDVMRLTSGCEHTEAVSGASAMETATQKTSHGMDSHTQLSHHEIKSFLISSSVWIGGLLPGNCVQSRISTSVHRKQWWQCWIITKFVAGGSHECSHGNRKNTPCRVVRCTETTQGQKWLYLWWWGVKSKTWDVSAHGRWCLTTCSHPNQSTILWHKTRMDDTESLNPHRTTPYTKQFYQRSSLFSSMWIT